MKLKTEKKGSELWVWAMVGVEVGAYKVEKKKFYMILTIITSKSGAARGSFAELAEDATRAAVKDVTRKTLNHPGFRAKLRAKGFDI